MFMDTIMEGMVVFVFIGVAVLITLAVLWYLFQTVRIIWAYNSLLAIASVIFSPIVHIIFYFMPKDNFDKHDARLFKKYFLSIGLICLLGILASIVIPAISSQESTNITATDNMSVEEVEILANKGNSLSQYEFGAMYMGGFDEMPLDYVKAAVWMQKSANQDNAEAQAALGMLYAFGLGVSQDYVQAKEWYGRACDQGLQASCDNYRRLDQ